MGSEFNASLEPKLSMIACLCAFIACVLTIVLDLFMLSITCATSFAKTRFIFHAHGTQLKMESNEGTNHSSILNMVIRRQYIDVGQRIAEHRERWAARDVGDGHWRENLEAPSTGKRE